MFLFSGAKLRESYRALDDLAEQDATSEELLRRSRA